MSKHPLPGRQWRTLAHQRGKPIEQRNAGTFDELVIDQWFHLEQMGPRSYWMSICGVMVNVHLSENGTARLLIEDDGGAGVLLRSRRLVHGKTWAGLAAEPAGRGRG